jgi:hypothetical protein
MIENTTAADIVLSAGELLEIFEPTDAICRLSSPPAAPRC